MDDGMLDCSNQEEFLSPIMWDSCFMGSFDDELHNDTLACTHTHTCNPPGPDHPHTHTCVHVHKKIVSAPTEDKVATDDTAESSEKKPKKRPLGNKEAVRKYRDKKKAETASMEEEVKNSRVIIQQLQKRLQEQAVLEAEIVRLKCLLAEIRGRIEGEIGSFPYQQSANNVNFIDLNPPGACVMSPCNMQCTELSKSNVQCNDQVYCLHPGVGGKSGEGMALN